MKYKKLDIEEELDIKKKSFKEAAKQFKEKDQRFIMDRAKAEARIKAMYELIENE